MNQLELNPEEEALLSQVLRRHLSDLEMEICHTDHADFRELLRRRREVLRHLLDRIPQAAEVVA